MIFIFITEIPMLVLNSLCRQTDLELGPPVLAPQAAGITGLCHQVFYYYYYLLDSRLVRDVLCG